MSLLGGEQGTDAEDAGTGRSLEKAEIHDVLRNDRRRLVLERLRETGQSESVRDLAEYIASVEAGESPPPKNVRQSVYVSLHQTHLPKLDDLGIVAYDSDSKEVTLSRNAPDVTVHMEVIPKYGLSWSEFYLGLALLGLLVTVASLVGVPVIARTDSRLLSVLIFTIMVVAGAYRVSQQQTTVLDRLR